MMADHTKIEWTDATWNPITGCSMVSVGCTNCYAMELAGTRLKHHPSRAGLTRESGGRPVWTGEVRLNEDWLDQPLRWRRPRMIFVCAHGDPFHPSVPSEWIARVFTVMARASQHTLQVLTKRPDRMRAWMESVKVSRHGFLTHNGDDPSSYGGTGVPLIGCQDPDGHWPLPNVWLGVSVEDQAAADERIPHLLGTPAAKRFVSCEPLLGPVDLTRVAYTDGGGTHLDVLHGWHGVPSGWRGPGKRLDWVICGGESGPRARPMHPDWARSLRDQCAASEVPFFFKQWGEWAPQVGAVDGWTIDDNPETSKYPHRDWEGGHYGEPYWPMWCDEIDDDTVSRIGKRAAGRLLDGRAWDQVPDFGRAA